MILQALAEYYDRRASDPESGIAPQGWERKEIPFVVVLDERGALVKIEDTREGAGSKKRARAFLVPQGEKKASGVRANLLWDTAAYVFGVAANGKPERLVRQKAAFSARIQNELGELPAVRPLLTFLESATVVRLAQEEVWGEIVQTNANVTFRVAGRGAEQTL
jgi:CRISPR-associated protein Csd1